MKKVINTLSVIKGVEDVGRVQERRKRGFGRRILLVWVFEGREE